MTDSDESAVRAALVRAQEERKSVHVALLARLSRFDLGSVGLEDASTVEGTTVVRASVDAGKLAETLEAFQRSVDDLSEQLYGMYD